MILSFDKHKLQHIVDSFFLVSGIHSAVFDDSGSAISWSQNMVRSPLCALLRRIPEFERQCARCDREACQRCRKTGMGERYLCHIGLEEFAVPIITDQNAIIGYIISGQLIPYGRREETLPRVLENCRRYGVEEARLIEAYNGHREMEARVVDAAFEILQACTAYAWMTRAASISEGSLAQRLSAHIRGNTGGDLSVPALCEALHISKTRLNRLSQEYFGTSIQNYVRHMRIDESKRLIAGGGVLISEVAGRVGIPDYNYFSKVFRSLEGVTPREYRKLAEAERSG